MLKTKVKAVVVSQEQLASDVYSLILQSQGMAQEAKAGQFVSIYSNYGSRLLPRPISICEVDKEADTLRLVYRVVGAGTDEFSKLQAGDTVDVIGTLGNGFPLLDKKAFLIGGGIGIPPMLQLAKELQCEKQIVVGYRDELFLVEDLEKHGKVYIASEDGKHGTKGNVIDAIRENGLDAEVIYACGPMPMLKALKQYAKENNIECYVSLEERMACGIGACLACVCNSTEVDHHTYVKNKRICKDGPVFLAEEVDFQ